MRLQVQPRGAAGRIIPIFNWPELAERLEPSVMSGGTGTRLDHSLSIFSAPPAWSAGY